MKIPDGLLESLALTIAGGNMTILAWSKANKIPQRSAYRWAKRPWVVARVETFREDQRGRNMSLRSRAAGKATKALERIVAKGSGAKDCDVVNAAKVLLISDSADSALADHNARLVALETAKANVRRKP